MKTKHTLSILLVILLMIGLFATPALAKNKHLESSREEQEFRFLYVNSVEDDFDIISGTAYVKVKYYGITNVTTRAEISIKLQHKFLFWWFDVSGGEWNDTVYGVNGGVNHSLGLTDGGNYRAVINVKVYGTGSGYDEIDRTPTASN